MICGEISVQTLNHLGIIAGIIDELGVVEQIDQRLGRHPKEIVSAGQVVKAMILNGLGFVSAPLYLFGKFFEGKAIEHFTKETRRRAEGETRRYFRWGLKPHLK